MIRRNPFRRLAPREVAVRSLEEAEIDLLNAANWREQYAANEAMLRGRIARLKAAITAFTPADASQEETST